LPLGAEPKLRIAAPASPSIYPRNFIENIMDAEEVFVNYCNFNPNRVKHASTITKSTNTQVKKRYFQGTL
jgi:hypothetical protein